MVYNTIKGLVALGHEITLISLDEKNPSGRIVEHDPILDKIQYRSYHIDISVSIWDAIVNLFSQKAHIIDRYYAENVERVLLKHVKKGDFDIIQFEGLFVTPYLPAIRKNTKAKIIYRAHNIEHQVWARLAQQKSDPIKKIYLGMLARRIKKYELQKLNGFDAIIAFTRQDEETIRTYGIKTPVEVMPISVDLTKYQPDHSKTEFPSLFFLGSLGWMPNREGIEWFIENFHSDLTSGDMRVKFYLAGNDIPEQFDEYEAPGKIFIQGEVDDVLEFMNNKAVMLVPLMSGGGMRVKIVEGMAMQKCIISTSLGAEGIDYTHGENIIIANTKQEFYDAIQRCIADEHYCKSIGQKARNLIEEYHNFEVVTNKIVAYYGKLNNA